MVRIGALEVMVRQALRSSDRSLVASYVTRGGKALEGPRPPRPLVGEVDAPRVCGFSEKRAQRAVERIPVHGAEERSNGSLPSAPFTAQASREEIRERLRDGFAFHTVWCTKARLFLIRDSIQNAHCPPAGGSSRQLQRPEDA